MNSQIQILVISNHSRPFVEEIIQNALNKFDYVVKKYSRFDPRSELSLLNNSKGKRIKVSRNLFDLISFALDLADKTNGTFDPTVIDLLEAYGYTKSFDKIQKEKLEVNVDKIEALKKTRPSFREIELERTRNKIKLHPEQRIDLGALGKGYAIDLAYEVLEEKFDNFMINGGGDVRVSGTNENEEPWKIALEYLDSKNQKIKVGFVRLTNQSICSSGGNARKLKKLNHIVNIKDNCKNDIIASFCIGPKAIEADAYATIAYLMGEDFINSKMLNKKFDVLLVKRNKEIVKSINFTYSPITN